MTVAHVQFQTKLSTVGPYTVVLLPKDASSELPSRGLVMVEGSINGHQFVSPLEPDGQGSHWLKVEPDLLNGIKAKAGDTVTLDIRPTKDWPEPEVPADLRQALDNDPAAKTVWDATTPLARWDWIRSVRSTNNPETRQRRIETACSKLRSGKPRQCCFNRSSCTDPAVSKGGVLLEPTTAA